MCARTGQTPDKRPAAIAPAKSTRAARRTRRHCRWPYRLAISVSTFALALATTAPVNTNGPWLHLSQANAVTGNGDIFSDLTPMNRDELEDARGGFSVGPLEINIGVTVTTSIDGFVAVSSSFTMDLSGLDNLGNEIKATTAAALAVAEAAVASAKATVDAVNEATADTVAAAVAGATAPAAPVVTTGPAIQSGNTTNTSAPEQTAALGEAAAQVNAAQQQVAEVVQKIPDVVANAAPPQKLPDPAAGYDDSIHGDPVSTGPLNVATAIQPAAPAPGKVAPESKPPVVAGPVKTANENPSSISGPKVTAEVKTPSAKPAPTVVAAAPAPTPPVTTNAVQGSMPDEAGNADHMVTVTAAPVKLMETTKIVHQNSEMGHISIISNRLDNVSIQQSVSLNMTVENFTRMQIVSNIQRTMATISRQIATSSLRR